MIYIIDTKYWAYLSSNKTKNKSEYNSIGSEIKNTLDKRNIPNYHIYINDIESSLNWLETLETKKIIIKPFVIWCQLILKIHNTLFKKILHTITGIIIMNIQINKLQPSIIWNMDPKNILIKYLFTKSSNSRYYIAHVSTELPQISELQNYNLLLSSHYNYIKKWKSLGLNAFEFKTAVNLEKLNPKKWIDRKLDLVFIGSITDDHLNRIELLTKVAQEFDIHIYGYGFEYLDKNSILRKNWKGYASGKRLFDIYGDTKIVINSHIDLAENIAGNQRLVEATGSGCLLMTENAINISNYFEAGEVVTYDSIEDLLKKIRIYINDDEKSIIIANAGHKRTIKNHNYDNRITEILQLIKITH